MCTGQIDGSGEKVTAPFADAGAGAGADADADAENSDDIRHLKLWDCSGE